MREPCQLYVWLPSRALHRAVRPNSRILEPFRSPATRCGLRGRAPDTQSVENPWVRSRCSRYRRISPFCTRAQPSNWLAEASKPADGGAVFDAPVAAQPDRARDAARAPLRIRFVFMPFTPSARPRQRGDPDLWADRCDTRMTAIDLSPAMPENGARSRLSTG